MYGVLNIHVLHFLISNNQFMLFQTTTFDSHWGSIVEMFWNNDQVIFYKAKSTSSSSNRSRTWLNVAGHRTSQWTVDRRRKHGFEPSLLWETDTERLLRLPHSSILLLLRVTERVEHLSHISFVNIILRLSFAEPIIKNIDDVDRL